MTTFVLVAGPFTGAWIWSETVARLREAGCEVHAPALAATGPDTDLDAQVEDLVRLIDTIDAAHAPQVVIVGHGPGAHPVLGAADRRPERIARVVYLDAGLPQDGASVFDLMPDQAVRDRMERQAREDGDGWTVPAPSGDGWQLWGSTADLSVQALDRLDRLAAPQPLRTLTQPLRLTGAAAGLPATGVLCTGNGSSIAMVQMVVGMGDPRLKALLAPEVSFFELDGGHWPMLARPAELAQVLIEAAAGQGHRLTAPTDQVPAHLRTFLLDPPPQRRERVGHVDLYLPELADDARGDAGERRPAVVFVHGGPVPAGTVPSPREWPTFTGYARYAASLGAVGVTLDHRLHAISDYALAAEDVVAAVELVRSRPEVDPQRVALWFFSGGGLLAADWLAAPPPWLRCLAATYPVLAPPPSWGPADSRFRPATAVAGAGRLPIVLTRVGKEVAEITATVEEFLAAATACDADVEVIDIPDARHGFETVDHTDEARDGVERAVRSVLGHLRT